MPDAGDGWVAMTSKSVLLKDSWVRAAGGYARETLFNLDDVEEGDMSSVRDSGKTVS